MKLYYFNNFMNVASYSFLKNMIMYKKKFVDETLKKENLIVGNINL